MDVVSVVIAVAGGLDVVAVAAFVAEAEERIRDGEGKAPSGVNAITCRISRSNVRDSACACGSAS